MVFVLSICQQLPQPQSHRPSSNTSSINPDIGIPLDNVTLNTPAIRARLECKGVGQEARSSLLVERYNIWYENSDQKEFSDATEPIDQFVYRLRPTLWENTTFNTSALSYPSYVTCCANASNNTDRSALGFWSTTDTKEYPHKDAHWPVPLLSKWILGSTRYFEDLENFTHTFILTSEEPDEIGRNHGYGSNYMTFEGQTYFSEEPVIQAVHCIPIIETAEADVTVDAKSGQIHRYQILNEPKPTDSPWFDAFAYHTSMPSPPGCAPDWLVFDDRCIVSLNITNRYGPRLSWHFSSR